MDDDMLYLSDDSERERDGVTATPLTSAYENIALRDDLASKLEILVEDARAWSEVSEDEDAEEIYLALVDIYDRLGEPLDETDD